MSLPGRWRWRDRPIFRKARLGYCVCNIDPPASAYAIMRRACPYRGENRGPGKDDRGELDAHPGIREQNWHRLPFVAAHEVRQLSEVFLPCANGHRTGKSCEGFRMPADHDGFHADGGRRRKAYREGTRERCWLRVPRALWDL